MNLKEGTCGYGVDGELGDEPAGPQLLKKKKNESRFSKYAQYHNYVLRQGSTGLHVCEFVEWKNT